MPRRTLTDEERELWHRVARTATRLIPTHAPGPDSRKAPVPDPRAAAHFTPGTQPDVQIPRSFSKAPPGKSTSAPRVHLDLAERVGDHLARQPVQMDRGLHKTMMRGKLDPDARIDLHGMTVAQAHQALLGFILSAHARGLRLVLVITGKGRKKAADHVAPMPVRAGVLKHEVPHWLRSAPLAPLVLELRESHRSHGGTGAYYVYLRKRR